MTSRLSWKSPPGSGKAPIISPASSTSGSRTRAGSSPRCSWTAGSRAAGSSRFSPTPTRGWRDCARIRGCTETGLGRAVAEHFLALLAARRDLTSIRFATYVKNRASIVTNERLGFRVRTVLSVKKWQGSRIDLAGAGMRERAARSASRMEVDTVRDERVIVDFLHRSGYFEGTQGLMAEGWRVFPFTAARFVERYGQSGACRGAFRGDGLAGLAARVIVRRPGRTGVKLVFLDAADDDTAGALLDDAFRGLAETPGEGAEPGETCEIEWILPPGERFRRWSGSHALASWEQEDDFLVYELPLETLGRYAADEKGDRQ